MSTAPFPDRGSAIILGWICKNRSPISTPITGEEQKDDDGKALKGFRWC